MSSSLCWWTRPELGNALWEVPISSQVSYIFVFFVVLLCNRLIKIHLFQIWKLSLEPFLEGLYFTDISLQSHVRHTCRSWRNLQNYSTNNPGTSVELWKFQMNYLTLLIIIEMIFFRNVWQNIVILEVKCYIPIIFKITNKNKNPIKSTMDTVNFNFNSLRTLMSCIAVLINCYIKLSITVL